jgi:hypothetical protein
MRKPLRRWFPPFHLHSPRLLGIAHTYTACIPPAIRAEDCGADAIDGFRHDGRPTSQRILGVAILFCRNTTERGRQASHFATQRGRVRCKPQV